MGAFADFQTAVFEALAGNPALTALAGAGKVFDDVPHGKEASAPAYPYVTIGDQSGDEDGASDVDAAEMTIEVHAWSRAPGRLECLRMLDAIRDALHDKSHAVATGVLVHLNYESHETVPEQDRETYHGVIRFKGFYHYG